MRFLRIFQIHQELQHLGLDRDVERAHRLVADDQFRLDRKRARDADALALTAGELVGVAVHIVAPEVHGFEQVADDFSALVT